MSTQSRRSRKYRKPRYDSGSHGADTHRRKKLTRGNGFCLDDAVTDVLGRKWIEEEGEGR